MGNKKKKEEMRNKRKKEAQIISKNKLRKIKQLEEEKRKKLLQQKSIEILEQHKISDDAYQILQSSGTLGQAETFKKRRLQAVRLSKAGLEVPEDIFTFKKKGNRNVIDGNEVNLDVDLDIITIEKGAGVCRTLSKRKEQERNDQSITTEMETYDEEQKVTDDGISIVSYLHSYDDNERKIIGISESQPQSLPILCSNNGKDDTKSEDKMFEISDKKREHGRDITNCSFQDHTSTPIVVSVFRPHEVEEKRKELPIIMMEQEIMEAINENFIVILCGETGCGKTTQVPQFLYEAGFGSSDRSDRKGIIGVTQPRRVAVLATAKRVSFELGFHLGKEVGFQVRHDKLIGKNCSIKFMTDGILLREVQSDFLLKKYSIIILDEAHERSLNTDILIGMLSRIITLRQKLYLEQQENIRSGMIISLENRITPLKLVLMSATLRVDDFASNRKLFNQTAPVLEVPVRQFPVAIHFSKRTHEDYLGQAYKKVMSIHKRLPPGGILVFVTGQREVEFLCKKLQKASKDLGRKDSGKLLDSELPANSDLDMREIDEAFGTTHDSPDELVIAFDTYEEDGDDLDSYFSSDSSSESELDFESDDGETFKTEVPEKTGLILDFLKDVDNLTSLKASFDALAGNSIEPNVDMEQSLPLAPSSPKDSKHAPKCPGPLYVLPLYAMLSASAQLRVFEEIPEGERLVVVATNVAETSLTIPGIKYVVDTGKEKVKNYNYTNGVATYEVSWISKASAAQRAGRAGRTGPDHCYRLYSSGAFSKDNIFPQFSCPEISKTPVDGVVLLMKSLGIDKVANFPFPTPPNSDALLEAEHCLKALEALDPQGKLTLMGRAMAQYPMSPRHSRMLLTVIKIMKTQKNYSRANFLLGYAIASAAALSFTNPFLMQFSDVHETNNDMDQEEISGNKKIHDEVKKSKEEKRIVREARARFCNPTSDVLTTAHALNLFELSENPVAFCRDNSLHLKTMEDMSKLKKQLLQLVFHQTKLSEDFSWDHGTAEDVEFSWRSHSDKQPLKMNEEELIGQAICAGWSDRVAKRVRGIKRSSENDVKVCAVRYQSCTLNDSVYLHRHSSVSRSAPEFLVYIELLQTKRPYMHGVTSVKSDWLVRYGSSLCTFSSPLADPKPYYEPLSDQVLCWVSPTFGKHNWQLPLHTVPFKNDIRSLSVFAAALLEGLVLPCLRSAQKFLAAPPSMILRAEALGQRRVGDLLKRLKIGLKTIDSRAMLREVWGMNPEHLKTEIQQWFQERYYVEFEDIWERMHSEVQFEGSELFPKRAKKERKLAR